jgi:protease IV
MFQESDMKKLALMLVAPFWLLFGCTVLNLSLVQQPGPLEERKLEGEGKAKILILDLDGAISLREKEDRLRLTAKPSTAAYFREALRKAEGDPRIAGVIVRINSPGSTIGAADTLYHEIMRFREKKRIPVIAYILEFGTSGAYYVACASDRIIAGPTAITGSIGVFVMRFNIEGLLSKIGVVEEIYKSGPKKDFWSPFRSSTDAEKKMIQDIIDRLYSRFLDVIHAHRGAVLTKEEVRALADGRIFTGNQALEAGVVDEVGYLDEVIERLKRDLHLERAKVVTYGRPGAFKSNIYAEIPGLPGGGARITDSLPFDPGEISFLSGIQFLYLWRP